MSDAPILAGTHHVTDLEAATDFERKHTPYLGVEPEGEKTRVIARVGHYYPHPNDPDHFIQWIELFANGAPIARFDFTPGVAYPDVSVVVALDPGTLIKAVEHCNLHGLWGAELTL